MGGCGDSVLPVFILPPQGMPESLAALITAARLPRSLTSRRQRHPLPTAAGWNGSLFSTSLPEKPRGVDPSQQEPAGHGVSETPCAEHTPAPQPLPWLPRVCLQGRGALRMQVVGVGRRVGQGDWPAVWGPAEPGKPGKFTYTLSCASRLQSHTTGAQILAPRSLAT